MSTDDNRPKTAIEHFDKAAEDYENHTGGCTRELAQCMLDRLPELADAGAPGTIILDNACGTGVVAEEIIQRHPDGTGTIYAVDAAPNMIDIARRKLNRLNEGRNFNITSHTMPSERLEFEDDTFTHSITNFGILFYRDSLAGAKEIHRTLRTGGVAIVTSWTDLGYLEPVVQASQLEIRPNEKPYQLPLAPEWLLATHLQSVLLQGGFTNVEVSAVKVHYGAENIEGVVELLAHSFQAVCKDWPEDERIRFRALMTEKTAQVAEEYSMPNGKVGIGIPMMASVAVCRK